MFETKKNNNQCFYGTVDVGKADAVNGKLTLFRVADIGS